MTLELVTIERKELEALIQRRKNNCTPFEEIARGPYEDSDCRSLCEALADRAQALLDKADGADVEAGQ